MPHPTPRHFGKRGWICLIPKGLKFFATTKRLQAIEGSRVKVELGHGTDQVCSRWQALRRGIRGTARIHMGLRGKGGAGRGTVEQKLGVEVCASRTG